MISYYVEFGFTINTAFDKNAEQHFDQVADAFADLAGVDGDVGVDMQAGKVELCITIIAADRAEALHKAFVAARTAVHAAGGATHGWDGWLEEMLAADSYRVSITPSALT